MAKITRKLLVDQWGLYATIKDKTYRPYCGISNNFRRGEFVEFEKNDHDIIVSREGAASERWPQANTVLNVNKFSSIPNDSSNHYVLGPGEYINDQAIVDRLGTYGITDLTTAQAAEFIKPLQEQIANEMNFRMARQGIVAAARRANSIRYQTLARKAYPAAYDEPVKVLGAGRWSGLTYNMIYIGNEQIMPPLPTAIPPEPGSLACPVRSAMQRSLNAATNLSQLNSMMERYSETKYTFTGYKWINGYVAMEYRVEQEKANKHFKVAEYWYTPKVRPAEKGESYWSWSYRGDKIIAYPYLGKDKLAPVYYTPIGTEEEKAAVTIPEYGINNGHMRNATKLSNPPWVNPNPQKAYVREPGTLKTPRGGIMAKSFLSLIE